MNATQTRLMGLLATWEDGMPVLSALAPHLGLAGESGVRQALEPLLKAGFVERVPIGAGRVKIARLTPQGWAHLRREEHHARRGSDGDLAPETLGFATEMERALPVFPISCGPWMEASAETEWNTSVLRDRRDGDYLCRVQGDSMHDPQTGRGYYEGELLHMRPGVYPENGDVVHAEYPRADGAHECTLKVFHLDEITGQVILWALNPKYPDIVRAAGQVSVRGKALEVVKPVGRYSRK